MELQAESSVKRSWNDTCRNEACVVVTSIREEVLNNELVIEGVHIIVVVQDLDRAIVGEAEFHEVKHQLSCRAFVVATIFLDSPIDFQKTEAVVIIFDLQ